jgi:iron(III) transport system permease protein
MTQGGGDRPLTPPEGNAQRLWRALGLLAYCAIALGPIAALCLQSLQRVASGHLNWLQLMVPQGRRLTLLLRTLGLALSVSLTGMALGLFIATVLWRWRSGGRTYLRWLLLALVPLPGYLHALGWGALVNLVDRAFTARGLAPIGFNGWAASWWVQMMALLPIAALLSLIGLESVDRDLIASARLMRSDTHTFLRVVLPLAAPILLAGGAFLFLLSLVDYSVPSLFQYNVYALEVFAEFTASNQAGRAFLLSVPIVLVALILLLSTQSGLRTVALGPPWREGRLELRFRWPRPIQWLQALAMGILLAQVCVPLLSEVLLAGGWRQTLEAGLAARHEIGFTLWSAAAAALLALPIGAALAKQLERAGSAEPLWWLITAAPLVMPASLVGIGLIVIWNRACLPPVYGSPWMPVLAALARFSPVAAIAILAQRRRLDSSLIDAAMIYQKGAMQTLLRVRIPLLSPGLLAAAGVVLVLAAGELGATLLVAPPGRATLTMRIYNYLHYGASETVASLGLLMSICALFCAGAGLLGFGMWSRLTSGRWRRADDLGS